MQLEADLKPEIDSNVMPGSACSDEVSVLTNIYDKEVNLAIWQDQLSSEIEADVARFLQAATQLNTSGFIRQQSIESDIREAIVTTDLGDAFVHRVAELVDMFCTLFELDQVGLRLRLLDSPMCPRFHVDRVPCRMVTAFAGRGTQWLEHSKVDRNKLGHGSQGLDDNVSGLFQAQEDIQAIGTGDVALLKGEAWMGNENSGVVHRSPPYREGEKRLLMTLDFLP